LEKLTSSPAETEILIGETDNSPAITETFPVETHFFTAEIMMGTSKNCIFEFDQQTVNDNPYSKLL